jgi:putative hydrolase of HD superfamily
MALVLTLTILLIVSLTNSPTDAFLPQSSSLSSTVIMSEHESKKPRSADGDDNNSISAAASSISRAIDFLTLTRSLKTTKRTGWIMRKVHQPESIADHMYRMSLMSMIASFSDGALDTNRCIKLALIHDLAEAKVGDITPHCGVSDKEKYDLELETMQYISKMLGPMMGGDEILELWKEYEEGTTEEARLLKDLDKIEMILQAQEYEVEGSHDESLDQFFTSTEGKWRTDIGKAWAAEIVSRRKIGGNSKSVNGVGKMEEE